jgi:hypothetical protein
MKPMICPPMSSEVLVLVSDPWDFFDEVTDNPFRARVVAFSKDPSADMGAMVLQVGSPFEYRGEQCEFFVASRRLMEPASGPRNWTECSYSLTLVSRERALGSTPFDLSWWRGGVGLLASLAAASTRANASTT